MGAGIADNLQQIMDAQGRLQERMLPKWVAMGEALGLDYMSLYLKENCVMLVDEALEAMHETPWKFHKNDFGRAMLDGERDRYLHETIDCLHFVVNMLIFAGVTSADEVLALYMEKNEINHDRQDRGY
jgi:dimeric dUTPase (all-alpha-NTP-PPase superfamily)